MVFCDRCLLDPCVCNEDNFSIYLIGKESNQFIGFENSDIENNCFLSTALQLLINTSAFSLILTEECIVDERCIICCLKRIKSAIDLGRDQGLRCISFIEHREDLSRICGESFGFGQQGDSVEAIEKIFSTMHHSSKGVFTNFTDHNECSGECHSHFLCGNRLREIIQCKCSTSESESMNFILRLDSSAFKYNVGEATKNLFNLLTNYEESTLEEASEMKNHLQNFPEIFKKFFVRFTQNIDSDIDYCSKCKSFNKKSLSLRSSPMLLIFQISWENYYNPQLIEILQFLLSLKGKLTMSELFTSGPEISMGLKGMIVFLANHYVFFGLGSDYKWYRVDDNMCLTVGIGRWYDVLLILLFMKGVPVSLIYEENEIADLSLYKMERLFLEKTVYNSSATGFNQAGSLDLNPAISINPFVSTKNEDKNITRCPDCSAQKTVGQVCQCCGFDPNDGYNWLCRSCSKKNPNAIIECSSCRGIRYAGM